MKFDKKDSKLFKNTKKFVYVSVITGVLLTGTQAGQFASTYTANADETAQTSSVTITFVDQFGNQIEKSAGNNKFTVASYSYNVQSVQVNKGQILLTLADFPGISKDTNDVPDILDLSKAGNYTFHLTQPTHTLTINLVDQNGNTVYTETNPNATQYTQTSTKNLSDWAQQHNYGYDSFPGSVDNSETTVNISVKAPTNTVVNQNAQQNNTTTTTINQSSATTTVQSSASNQTVKSSAQSNSSSESEKSSEAQSSASNDNKKGSALSAATSIESLAQSSTASSAASQAPKSDEKTMVIVDSVNKGEHKKAQQAPAAEKKDVRAKLPQTGDNTNQAKAIALGVATIAVGLSLAYFGLRRKNK